MERFKTREAFDEWREASGIDAELRRVRRNVANDMPEAEKELTRLKRKLLARAPIERVFHSDPQHGWLAVKRSELIELGILEQVSGHSYQKGQTVYLEEDADADLYFKAFRARYGGDPPYRQGNNQRCYHGNSPVRSYDMFTP